MPADRPPVRSQLNGRLRGGERRPSRHGRAPVPEGVRIRVVHRMGPGDVRLADEHPLPRHPRRCRGRRQRRRGSRAAGAPRLYGGARGLCHRPLAEGVPRTLDRPAGAVARRSSAVRRPHRHGRDPAREPIRDRRPRYRSARHERLHAQRVRPRVDDADRALVRADLSQASRCDEPRPVPGRPARTALPDRQCRAPHRDLAAGRVDGGRGRGLDPVAARGGRDRAAPPHARLLAGVDLARPAQAVRAARAPPRAGAVRRARARGPVGRGTAGSPVIPHWLALALALVGLAGTLAVAIARPPWLPEAAVAAATAILLVVVGAVSIDRARQAISDLAPTIAFLAALLLLADGCRRQGLFEALGQLMARRSGDSPRRLLGLVFVVAASVTVVLGLDSTIVLLTPVVFATATRLRMSPTPHVYACSHLANSASLLLPVANLTNLLAYRPSGLSFTRFAVLMALPTAGAIAVEWFV